jgi:hypothetical protein
MRPQKITFGDIREMGVRGIFVHSVRARWSQIATAWPHTHTKPMMFAPAAAGEGWIGKVASRIMPSDLSLGETEAANLGEGLLPTGGHLTWGLVGSLDSTR